MSLTLESIKAKLAAANQSHLLTFYDTLPAPQQASLHAQLDSLDFPRIASIHALALAAEKTPLSTSIAPPPVSAFASTLSAPKEDVAAWRRVGLKAIAEGKVGVLLMAGGQGTRLGSSDPKGMYDVGLPSGKSLFQMQAERIDKVQRLAAEQEGKKREDVRLLWLVMTSGPTHAATQSFFESKNYFGLRKDDVVFFQQGTLPCLTEDGKVLLSTPSSVAVAPDGNGGVYSALRSPISASSPTTPLDLLTQRGITSVHAYCVDNSLCRVADPVFLGYSILAGASCGAKVVRKANPTESVGVVALRADKYTVIEYSELPAALAEQREPSGELAFRAANIANHFYTVEFLQRVSTFEHQMAYHVARKKIPTVDLSTGSLIKPSSPNGLKLELFIFDVFPFTSLSIFEVARADEFSPLKNATDTGADDPQTSRRDVLAQAKRWVEAAGGQVAEGVELELAPTVSYDGEGLEKVKGKKVVKGGNVESWEELEKLLQ